MHKMLDTELNVVHRRSISKGILNGSNHGERVCDKTVKESSEERRARNDSQH